MICVNFKLSEFHAGGSGYVLRAGRGKLRHNSGGFKERFCPPCLCATLHTTEKAGKWILEGSLCAKTKRGKRQNNLSFARQSWAVGNKRVFVTGRQGAACPLLAKPPIWELHFYLGVAHERKTHFWVLQDIFCPIRGGGLRHSCPADHPPPPHSQRLFLRLVSLGHSGAARDQEQFGNWKNINSCRFRKQEIEIFVIELSLQGVRHNYEVKMENLSGSGAWKMHWGQELCNVARCLSLLELFHLFFFFFFLKLKMRIRKWGAGGERKQEHFTFWADISKMWHSNDDIGENFNGSSGLLFSDVFQGRFRWNSGERKGDRHSPTQELLDISHSLIPTLTESGLSQEQSLCHAWRHQKPLLSPHSAAPQKCLS